MRSAFGVVPPRWSVYAGLMLLNRFKTPSLDKMNCWFTQLFYGGSALLGSISSVLLHSAFIWAVFRLVLGSFKLTRERVVYRVAAAFALYPLAELASSLFNQRGLPGLQEVAGQIVFLSVLPVVSRLCVSAPEDILKSFSQGAAIGGVIALLFTVVQLFALNMGRAEAGFGNAGILAVSALIFVIVCLIAWPHARGRERHLLEIGAICAVAAMLLSGMRAVWIGALPAIALASIPAVTSSHFKLDRKLLLKFVGVGALLLVIAGPLIYERFAVAFTDIEGAANGQAGASLGHRLVLWKAGLAMALEHPFFGYGPDAVSEMSGLAFGSSTGGYSHFHNFILSALIRGGIVELAAVVSMAIMLIYVATRASESALHRSGQYLLLALVCAFYVPGLFGIMFDHDIMNAMFVYTVIVALSFGRRSNDGDPLPID